MSLLTNVRVIDHQELPGVLQEVVRGPDGRVARYFVRLLDHPQASSQVWSGAEWKPVHNLLDVGPSVAAAMARLTATTEDILGWSN